MARFAQRPLCAVSAALTLHDLFRLRPGDGPKERAIEKLLWVVSRRAAADVELVTTLAVAVFSHMGNERRVGTSDP